MVGLAPGVLRPKVTAVSSVSTLLDLESIVVKACPAAVPEGPMAPQRLK